MKLKAKLFLSFGMVMILGLSILGIIILYSFSENIKTAEEENIRLKTTIIADKAREALHKPLDDIYYVLISCLSDHLQSHSPYSAQLTNKIEKIITKSPFIEAAYIFSDKYPATCLSAGRTLDDQLLSLIKTRDTSHIKSQLILLSNRVYLVQQMLLGPNLKHIVAVELNTKILAQLFEDLHNIEQSILILVDSNKQSVLVIDHLQDKSISSLNLAQIVTGKKNLQNLTGFKGFIYQHQEGFLGNQLFLVVNNSFFLKCLSALKDRILVGILIVSWVLIWVILIVSHKISSPIRKLSELTREIVAFNYETELQANSNDEIGELTKSFEAMRQRIKDLVAKDPLTQIYNRRFLMHILEQAVSKAIRLEQNLSCIIMDIDFFKKINDTHGHLYGDKVLVEIGKILLDITRNYDTPARFGGEEFIFVLPDTDIDCAYNIAERIRKKIETLEIDHNGVKIRCTMSLGVSSLDPEATEPIATIVHCADSALYRAKKKGRNCTVIFDGSMNSCHG